MSTEQPAETSRLEWNLDGPHTGPGARAYLYLRTNEANAKTIQRPLIVAGPFPGTLDPDAVNGINPSFCNELVNPLRARGFDVVYIRYFAVVAPANSIEQCAFAIIDGIRTVQLRMAESGSKERLVVAGISLGGLAARAALVYIEAGLGSIKEHRTRMFLSLDAPHQGAVLPAAVIDLCRQLYVVGWLGTILNVEQIREIHLLVTQTLTKQLLPFDFSGAEGEMSTPSLAHAKFFADLWHWGGYPRQVDARIALANGSGVGSPLAVAGDDALRTTFCKVGQLGVQMSLRYEAGGALMNILNLTAYEVCGITRVNAPEAWSVVPGGYGDFIRRIFEKLPKFLQDESYMSAGGYHCFVPTISALDDVEATSLYQPPRPGNSNFDDYWVGSANTAHCAVSPEMRDFIIQALTTDKYPGPTRQPRRPAFGWRCTADWRITQPDYVSVRNASGRHLDCYIKSLLWEIQVSVSPHTSSPPQYNVGPSVTRPFRAAEFWDQKTKKKLATIGGFRAWPCDQIVSYSEAGGGSIVAREWRVDGKQYWRLPAEKTPPGRGNIRLANDWSESVTVWVKGSGENKEVLLGANESVVSKVAESWEGELEWYVGTWHIGTLFNQRANRNVTLYGPAGKASLTDGPFIAIASM